MTATTVVPPTDTAGVAGRVTDSLHAGQEPDPATVERRGITTRFVDTLDYDAYAEAIDEDTAYVHLETFGEQACTYAAIARGLRDLGNQQAPFDAWQTIQGLETLPLRMERHCENAMAVAEFLD